jgi:hypothetical protein
MGSGQGFGLTGSGVIGFADPGAAGKQGASKPGPTAHQNDPIHVQQVGGQQQPPMGANHNGASVTSVGSASPGL